MTSKYKQEYQKRVPDYGVPYSMVGYGTYTEKILYYAKFKNEYFAYEDYQAFRVKHVRRDTFRDSVNKLLSYGWLQVRDDGKVKITSEGVKAVRSIAARNTFNPKRKSD